MFNTTQNRRNQLAALVLFLATPSFAAAQSWGDVLKGVVDAKSAGSDWLGAIKSVAEVSFGQIIPGAGPKEADGKVVLYSTSWCGYCKKAVSYMQQNKIPFSERNIESNALYKTEYKAAGGKGGVPFLVFGSKTMMGYNESQISSSYAQMQQTAKAAPSTAPAAAAPSVAAVAGAVQGAVGATAPSVAVPAAAPSPAALVALQAGDSLAAKLPGITVFTQPSKTAPSLLKLTKTDEVVIYMGEERDGLYRVTTSSGEGWVDKLLVKKL
jgi:glutaredoxin